VWLFKETGSDLSVPKLDQLISCGIDEISIDNNIDRLYERIVYILTNAERQFVPKRSKNFNKFW